MPILARTAAALVAAATFAPVPESVELVHRMPAGRTVEITLRQTETSAMVSQVWNPVEGGEVVTDQANEFDTRYEPSFDTEIVLRDSYGEVDDEGRLLSLERTFESVEASHEWIWESEDDESSGEDEWGSPLDGRTVAFEWSDDDDEYEASFSANDDGEDSGFDDALLEGMRIDAFGDWYLPPAEEAKVEIGDSWDAGVDAWHRTLDIGGDFWIGPEREEPPTDDEIWGRRTTRAELRSGGEGEVVCTYRGLETVDDVELAVIEIEFDVEVDSDIGIESEDEVTDVETAMQVEGSGRLLWDVAAGLPRSLELEVAWTTTESVATYENDVDDGVGDGDAWTTVTETESAIEYTFRVTD